MSHHIHILFVICQQGYDYGDDNDGADGDKDDDVDNDDDPRTKVIILASVACPHSALDISSASGSS